MSATAISPETITADSAGRVRRAASDQTGPSELRELAHDANVLVRAAVAINRTCAPEVDQVLIGDSDERVRAFLATRLARLLPEVTETHRVEATCHVRATLAVLVEDEAVRVRAAIADAVKDMSEAPRELILRLARDPALTVSDPVVRLSPVLTDADLLAVLATPPHPSAAVSIASRQGLSVALTDALAKHANAPAIKAMLANPSAQIREATLDGLVGRAPEHQEWHSALVRRPALSPGASRALSSFVATHLLEVLAQRPDLDPAVVQVIRGRLAERLNDDGQEEKADRALITEALRFKKANALDETVLLGAARTGQIRWAAAVLAVACEVPLSTIDRVIGLRSAKALVSLAWGAGFSMRAATAVQTALGQLCTGHILTAVNGDAFPLSEDEMRWQLELLSEIGHRPALPEPCRAALASRGAHASAAA